MTVDYFIDKSASTGEFEVIYEVPIAEIEDMKKNKQQVGSNVRNQAAATTTSASASIWMCFRAQKEEEEEEKQEDVRQAVSKEEKEEEINQSISGPNHSTSFCWVVSR